ncbi:nucleotidyl transferase AbiEii/AbiGii toxin family protein [Kitasatospora sp. NPDC088134]|uniref:nucleotidyl transferase AbiEii/AbiGii toxin family protein n=1 Tax=Kitasatospora sp. NPDC088134 TaxID=3364071 RepID=UPI003814BED7
MTDAREIRQRRHVELPPTFRPIEDPRAVQPVVFDPAMKHYADAYRPGDPRFADPALGAAWSAARRHAMDAVLRVVADSGWVDHLVLRGSVLLRAWFGAAAREPGDLDFVVVPEEWAIDDPRTGDLLHGLVRAAAAEAGPVRFLPAEAVIEDIWTYERVPGRRLLLPWAADGLPGGTVQLDFVFHEPLPVPPEPCEVAPGAVLNTATRELSLAWKLLWLHTDSYPQGKDLYDAALLAGSTGLRYAVLRDVFVPGEAVYAEHPFGPDSLRGTEWAHFVAEYPHLAGEEADHLRTLAAALAPTFAEVPADARAAWWVEGWLVPLRTVHAAGGPDAAAEWLRERHAHPPLARRLLDLALAPGTPGS